MQRTQRRAGLETFSRVGSRVKDSVRFLRAAAIGFCSTGARMRVGGTIGSNKKLRRIGAAQP